MSLYQRVPHDHTPRNVNEYKRAIASFNQRLALVITSMVSTMWAAYIFAVLAIIGFPGFDATPPQYVQWLSQTFIQLVMLAILSVSQGLIGKHQELQEDERFTTTQKMYHDLEDVHQHLEAQDAALVVIQKRLDELAGKEGRI